MIKPENVTFPITAGDLIVLQRKELGREITPTEAEFFALVADMANEAYGAACAGDADTSDILLMATAIYSKQNTPYEDFQWIVKNSLGG